METPTRRGACALALSFLAAACAGSERASAPEPPLPTRTPDGRVIVRGQGLVYAIQAPPGWNVSSVRAADRSTRSTLTVADLSPPDGSPVSISGQVRTKTRAASSIDSWVESVTTTRRRDDPDFTMSRRGPIAVEGGKRAELFVLTNARPTTGAGSSIDHEAVVVVDDGGALAEIFLTTKTRELLDRHVPTLRGVAFTYGRLG